MRIKTLARCLTRAALAAALGGPLLASAQDAGTLYVKALAATCANCHGTQGRAVQGSAVVGLAGVPAAHIAEQMKAFKSGARAATVMHQIAKGYTDAQIDQMAAYFAAQPK